MLVKRILNINKYVETLSTSNQSIYSETHLYSLQPHYYIPPETPKPQGYLYSRPSIRLELPTTPKPVPTTYLPPVCAIDKFIVINNI